MKEIRLVDWYYLMVLAEEHFGFSEEDLETRIGTEGVKRLQDLLREFWDEEG